MRARFSWTKVVGVAYRFGRLPRRSTQRAHRGVRTRPAAKAATASAIRDGNPQGRDSACRGSLRGTTARPVGIALHPTQIKGEMLRRDGCHFGLRVWLGCPWQQRRAGYPRYCAGRLEVGTGVVNGSRPREIWQRLLALESRDVVRQRFERIHGRTLNARPVGEINAAARQAREYFRNAGVVVRRLHSESCYRGRPTFGRTTCRKCSARSPQPRTGSAPTRRGSPFPSWASRT